ncbi:MAG TPA: hypothetical protein VJ885_12750 [Thermoanaerobaculia bacterium]|nr:hypothetical protein [Thermoanaerobaculia bacterium]
MRAIVRPLRSDVPPPPALRRFRLVPGGLVFAGPHDGAYSILRQTFRVQFRTDVAAGGKRGMWSFGRVVRLTAAGTLPAALLEADKRHWRRILDSWTALASRHREELARGIERFHDDLREQIDSFLRSFPDRLVVRQTGSNEGGFLFEGAGVKKRAPGIYDPAEGRFMVGNLGLEGTGIGSSSLLLRHGAWKSWGSLPGRRASWALNASLAARPARSGEVRANLGLSGHLSLRPVR